MREKRKLPKNYGDHDGGPHCFAGILPIPKSEALSTAFEAWPNNGFLPLDQAEKVFRHAEKSEAIQQGTKNLPPLSLEEILHYTNYFNGLFALAKEQWTEINPKYIASFIQDRKVLKTPASWLA